MQSEAPLALQKQRVRPRAAAGRRRHLQAKVLLSPAECVGRDLERSPVRRNGMPPPLVADEPYLQRARQPI